MVVYECQSSAEVGRKKITVMAEVSRLSIDEKSDTSLQAPKRSGDLTEKLLSPDLKFAFGWNRFNLSLIGLWPDQTCKGSQSSLIVRYSPPIWSLWAFSFMFGPQAAAAMVYAFVIDDLIQIVAALAGIIGACVKIIVLWNNGEVLAWCLSFLARDWMQKLSTDERELMMKNARFGRNVSIGFSLLMYSLVWSYVALKAVPLFYLQLDTWNATDIGMILMYPAYVPLDLRKPSNFAFVWIGQLIATVISNIAYTATDCFIAMLVIHLCGQISIVRHALINLLDNEKSLEPKTFRENLAVIVKRHDTLVKFAAVIEDTFNLMLLVLILIYTIIFGLQLFGLLTAVTGRTPGKFPFLQILFFISYLSVTIVHLFLYCYVGGMLIDESEALGLASYSCKWYNLSGSDAKDLIILMQRATVPLEISGGKFVSFSIELFGNILKTSMSYFSVLLTMKEQSLE